jgi:hypothetical protein
MSSTDQANAANDNYPAFLNTTTTDEMMAVRDGTDHDPACAADQPDSPRTLTGLSPLALIASLSASGDISANERDAAEIVARMASFVYSRPAADGATHIPMRDAGGRWSNPLMRGMDIKIKLEAALDAVKTPRRRRDVTLALVASERDTEWHDTVRLSAAFGDIARHFWPAGTKATHQRNGVTLPGTGPQDATPERLQHANDNLVEEGVRRIVDSPFARMHLRSQLDPDDGINEILFSAGRNYHQDFYYSGLGGISGIDYSRVGGGGGDVTPTHHMPRSEFALRHRLQFRSAREALGERYRPVVDAVVLEESTISSAAANFTGSTDARQATAKERLNVGLRRLAVFYGLMRHAA